MKEHTSKLSPPPTIIGGNPEERATNLKPLAPPPVGKNRRQHDHTQIPSRHFFSTPDVDVMNITLSYVPEVGLFERLNHHLGERRAKFALSAIGEKLEVVERAILAHPTVTALKKNPDEVETALQVALRHPIITQALFANMLRLGGRETPAQSDVRHTWGVLRDALILGIGENRTPRELLLIAIAASFYKLGEPEKDCNNFAPQISAAYARDAMECCDRIGLSLARFTPSECHMVQDMILDTAPAFGKIAPQSHQVTTPLSQYLLDADTTRYGREEFQAEVLHEYNAIRITEARQVSTFAEVGRTQGGGNFLRDKLLELSQHRWFTKTAQALFDVTKQLNMTGMLEAVRQ